MYNNNDFKTCFIVMSVLSALLLVNFGIVDKVYPPNTTCTESLYSD